MTEIEEKCFKVIINSGYCWNGTMCINIVNISSMICESVYKTRKAVKKLKEDGLVKLVCVAVPQNCEPCEMENIPPYWGYCTTKKGDKHLIAKEAEVRENKAMEKWSKS